MVAENQVLLVCRVRAPPPICAAGAPEAAHTGRDQGQNVLLFSQFSPPDSRPYHESAQFHRSASTPLPSVAAKAPVAKANKFMVWQHAGKQIGGRCLLSIITPYPPPAPQPAARRGQDSGCGGTRQAGGTHSQRNPCLLCSAPAPVHAACLEQAAARASARGAGHGGARTHLDPLVRPQRPSCKLPAPALWHLCPTLHPFLVAAPRKGAC